MQDNEQIKKYYNSKLSTKKLDFTALGWENQNAQVARFDALTDNLNLNNKTLLDVGCGLGHLIGHLRAKKIKINYLGIDMLPEMIQQAKTIYPNELFIQQSIFDKTIPEESFDVVFASGIFNLNTQNQAKLLREGIFAMADIAKEIVCFNLLSTLSPNQEPTYTYHDSKKIINLLITMRFRKEKIKIIDNYLNNDFTVIIFK